MKLRRKTSRNSCADVITIRWNDDTGQRRSEVAILDDISPVGACIGLNEGIAPETKVSLHYPKGQYQGKIKYCRYFELGYFLGVAFDKGYRWSKKDFEPSFLVEVPDNDETAQTEPVGQSRGRRR
jgi:hypothetical protein